MRKIILLSIILTGLIWGTNWKGGNTANIDGDTACYSEYLVHTANGCETTLTSLPCVPVVLAGDTICLPIINLDSLGGTTYVASETLYIDTGFATTETIIYIDTIYNYDTMVVWQQGNTYFNTIHKYVCDSTIIYIDTTTTPDDTGWCSFCDSVLEINWWRRNDEGGGIENFAYWQVLMPSYNDTCDIYHSGSRHIEYNFCYDCDTNIYIDTVIFVDSTVLANSGFWVQDSTTGEGYYVHWDDTVYLHNLGQGGDNSGIWWRYCYDTTNYNATDSFDLFTCIDTTWRVFFRNHRFVDYSDDVVPYIRTSPSYTPEPNNFWATWQHLAGHTTYGDMYVDSIAHYFGADSLIINDGADTILVKQALYYDFDTTMDYGGFSRPCECSCLYDYEYCEGHPNNNDCNCGGDKRIANLELFTKTFDFSVYYPDSEIEALNNSQPDWIILTFSDDAIPFIAINGVVYYLDTIPDSFYNWRIYEISPQELNYSEPMKIEAGLWSNKAVFIGGQVIFGLKLDTTEIVYHYNDTLVLPVCCSDTICIDYQWRVDCADTDGVGSVIRSVGNICYRDTTLCYSVCGDTTAPVFTLEMIDSMNFIGFADTSKTNYNYIEAEKDEVIFGGNRDWAVRDSSGSLIMYISEANQNIGILGNQEPAKDDGRLQVNHGIKTDSLRFETGFADSLQIGSGSFIRKWWVGTDTLFFIVGSDTFYAPKY